MNTLLSQDSINLTIFPPYLIAFTIVLVLLTLAAIRLRRRLYEHLEKRNQIISRLLNENSPGDIKFLEPLQERYKKARGKLEQVNTVALVDGVYSQEECRCFGFYFRCEQIDYFCKVFPGLLLGFGLLGTFFGITFNLTSLSQTMTQVNATDVGGLVAELEKPLQGMGVAFISSLVAITCSSILTLFNILWNTNFMKNQLISYLEDYLDNIYQPKIEGDSRLDKAVNRMVKKQEEFLTRFHTNVTEAVENALGKVAQQIADGNQEATNLAREVYERFLNTAGVLDQGATNFAESASIISTAAQEINQSNFTDKLSVAAQNLANSQSDFHDSFSTLKISLESIERTVTTIETLANGFSGLNEYSAQVLEKTESNQNLLSDVIEDLHEGTRNFKNAVGESQNLQEEIEEKKDSLKDIQVQLTQLVDSIFEKLANDDSSLEKIANELNETVIQMKIALLEETNLGNKRVSFLGSKINKQLAFLEGIQSELKNLTKMPSSTVPRTSSSKGKTSHQNLNTNINMKKPPRL